jgi:thioredoxin-dependent peroxiredoxin
MTLLKPIQPARLLLALAFLICAGTAAADDEYQKIIYIRVGDVAPTFELKDDQGKVWNLARHCAKKPVVLYFYCGDFMKSCTRQACAYRDDFGKIEAQGAEVVGVSGDEVENHQLFKEKYRLKQTLLSDDAGRVGQVFGLAWSGGGTSHIKDDEDKEIKLKRGVTESRWTWIIGTNGRVLYKNTNVNPDEDSQKVLKFLTEWNAKQQR